MRLRGFAAAFGFGGAALALRSGDARLERLHEVDHRRRLGNRLGHRDLLAAQLGLEQRTQVAAGSRSSAPPGRTSLPARRSAAGRARARSSSPRSPPPPPRSRPASRRPRRGTASPARARRLWARTRHSDSRPERTKRPIATHAGLAHRLQQQPVGPPLRRGGRRERGSRCGRARSGSTSVERHELRDLDRTRVVVLLERLQLLLLDDHELALGDLPALDQLVGADLAIVLGAPALLLDRRQALAVQQTERDVRLAGGRLGGRRQTDRDRDQAEGEGSVPGDPHGNRPQCRRTDSILSRIENPYTGSAPIVPFGDEALESRHGSAANDRAAVA